MFLLFIAEVFVSAWLVFSFLWEDSSCVEHFFNDRKKEYSDQRVDWDWPILWPTSGSRLADECMLSVKLTALGKEKLDSSNAPNWPWAPSEKLLHQNRRRVTSSPFIFPSLWSVSNAKRSKPLNAAVSLGKKTKIPLSSSA